MNFGKLKKGKLALMCMAAAVAVSMSACGDSKADQETQETEQTMQTAEQESTDSTPSTEQERVGDREDYVGLQDLEIEDYVTLPDYTDMKVSAARPAVDDGTVEQYIDSGKKDGVAFDGGTASGYRLTIGSGGVIPGFEAGLVGVMPGETVDLELTFPESYDPNPDLAGQEVVFTVTVNGIEGSAQYGTVTPEEMESLGLPYRTKEEVWEAGKKAVEQKEDETFEANAKSAVVQKLVEESGFQSIPEYLVEEETQNYNLYMESIAAMYGVDLYTFVTGMSGLTREEDDSQVNEMCTEIVKQYMVMEAVARAEGIEITDEMIHGQADGEAAEYGYASGDELISDVGFTTYRMSIVQDKVIGRLMEVVPVGEEETQQAADS